MTPSKCDDRFPQAVHEAISSNYFFSFFFKIDVRLCAHTKNIEIHTACNSVSDYI